MRLHLSLRGTLVALLVVALIPGMPAAAEGQLSPADQTTTCAPSGAIRALSLSTTLPEGDDNSSLTAVDLGFTLNFFGTNYTQLFVNNNGNVTFGSALGTFTSSGMSGVAYVTLAPFFADVETSGGGGTVTYGQVADIGGRPAFAVNWNNVGYYNNHVDKLNNFQLVIINRDDRNVGDFDFEFNYSQVQWETGDASGGSGGLGGTSATVGYADGSGGSNDYEVPNSRVPGSFLDSNASTGLIHTELDSGICGRYSFEVILGTPPDTTPPTVTSIVRAGASPTNAASVDFTVTFSESVTNVDTADFALTTTGVSGASITGVSAGPPLTTYTVSVNTGSGSGTIRLDLTSGATIQDLAANPFVGPYTGGETYTIDKGGPSIVSVLRAGASPTNAASVDFTVTFDESVTNVGTADFALTTTGVGGASITGVSAGPSAAFTVTVNTGSGSGTIRLDLGAGATIQDLAGNAFVGPYTGGETYTIDKGGPSIVSVLRADPSPTNAPSVQFTVTFDESVTNVGTADFALTTTGVSGASITGVSAGPSATYTVSVNTGSGSGTIRLDLSAGAAIQDLAGNAFVGPYTGGESYTIDKGAPSIVSVLRAGASPTNAASVDFTVTFSESVTNVDTADFALTTAGVTGASITGVSAGPSATYTVTVDTGSGSGTVRLDLTAGATIQDSAGNAFVGPYTGGETYTIDKGAPSIVSIVRADPSPTNAASVDFTVTFDESVSNVDTADFALTTTGVAGAFITNITAGPSATYTVTVDTGSGSGTIRLDLTAGATIQDLAANAFVGPYTGGETYTIDKTNFAVTSILRQDPLTSPTNLDTVTFRVTFAEDMQNVDTGDFAAAVNGTVAGTVNTVNLQSASVYDVVITGITGDGTLGLGFQAGNDIQDLVGNPLGASPTIGTAETYTIDNTAITVIAGGVVGLPGDVTVAHGGSYLTHFIRFKVTFDSDASNPAGSSDPDDVTNPVNYVLIEAGPDGVPGMPACGAADSDDVPITIGPITYNNKGGAGPYVANVIVNGGTPLPSGVYRLFVCGSVDTIVDLAGNPLNGGADTIRDFTVFNASSPATGFAPGEIVLLPEQPASLAYSGVGMRLEIPRLGTNIGIVGVPLVAGKWNVTWLGNDAGWLEGTAYPTWAGNSVLTGHAWDAFNRPGPFAGIGQLQYGDEVILESGGLHYVYAVRAVWSVRARETGRIFRHEELPWLTLLTCQDYDPATGEYARRLVVRAVLLEIR
jgi:LPXTG-site transpeptidase (sortase) family protein